MSGFDRGRGGRGGRDGGGGRDSGGGRGRDGGGGRGRDGGGRGGDYRGGGGRDGSRGQGGGPGGGGRGDFRGGGRDFGGGGGGRDAGRGRGRGGGRNRQMGEIPQIMTLSSNISDREVLSVINPPANDRNRASFIGPLAPMYDSHAVTLPGHAPWRYSATVGKLLTPQQIVRANHFKLDTRKVASRICHYHVHLYRYDRDNNLLSVDVAPEEDVRVAVSLMSCLLKKHIQWRVTGPKNLPVGINYDGRSSLFTSAPLPITDINSERQPMHTEDVFVLNQDETESRKKYRISLTLIGTVFPPSGGAADWAGADQSTIRALDTALFSFARWQQVLDDPDWFLVGSKAFRASGEQFRLSSTYVAMRGYFAGLKVCLAGLVLVCDMSVSCFLAGGEMVSLMANIGGYRNVDDMLREASSKAGLSKRTLDTLNNDLKNCKCRLVHIGHWKKVKALGPPANHPDSSFDMKGKKITVDAYFQLMARERATYRDAIGGIRLRYPFLPTINVGTKTNPILVPAELVSVPGGQCRSQKMTGDMTAQMIRHAAVRPDERFQYITDSEGGGRSILHILPGDETARAFGLDGINAVPMAVAATILPQAKIQYGNNQVVDPGLTGGWDIGKRQFRQAPPNPSAAGYMYGVLLIGDRQPHDFQNFVQQFMQDIEKDSVNAGVKVYAGGPPMACSTHLNDLLTKLGRMKEGGVRIVLCMLVVDCYSIVKLTADKLGLMTQCLKWKNIERPPRGFHLNVMLKINTKLGGTNHTLISRAGGAAGARPAGGGGFQDPPASLCWLFDKPCMLVGMDVSHAEPGSDRQSMAAVVASMDGRACQYAAHISAQPARVEIVSALEEAMRKHLLTFKSRNNGQIPCTIVVYRDGVGDGQFEEVVAREVPAIKGALAQLGYPEEACKIIMVVCQKGHHTRLVYEESPGNYINPCPGLLIDATGGENSIVSGKYNEFYLNSHTAIQGTAKPCKYALVYDEVGIKIPELELLTYWTTYLYCRCNRSVSYATPAYYAHWASKRAKNLFAAGGTAEDLIAISNKWSEEGALSTMFFV